MKHIKKILFTLLLLLIITIPQTTTYSASITEKYEYKRPFTLINNSIIDEGINIIDYEGLFFLNLDSLSYLTESNWSYEENEIRMYPSNNNITINNNQAPDYVEHIIVDIVLEDKQVLENITCLDVSGNIYVPFPLISKEIGIEYWYIRNGSQLRFSKDGYIISPNYSYTTNKAKSSYENFKILSNSDIHPPLVVDGKYPSFSTYKYYRWDKLITPTITYAHLIKNTNDFKTGDKVEIIEDTGNGTNYRIKKNGIENWVTYDYLEFTPLDFERNKHELSKLQIETYINNKGLESKTPHLIWVDIARQRTYIFQKDANDYFRLIRNELCTTGNNVTITVRGEFEVLKSDPPEYYARGTWFYGASVNAGAKYWVKFYKNYMFHSITYEEDTVTIADSELGYRNSHGCIRLVTETAKWIYDNIAPYTKVYIN